MIVVAVPHYLVMRLVATNTATRHTATRHHLNPVVMLLSPAVTLNRIATTAILAKTSELISHQLDLPLARLQIYAAAVPNLVTPLLNAYRATTRRAGLCLSSLMKNTPPTKPCSARQSPSPCQCHQRYTSNSGYSSVSGLLP
jgi:hypothetical protein